MLELRPTCEPCNKPLPPHALDARICSYECTFCAACVEKVLANVCPNCGGGFVPPPLRPAPNWKGDNFLGQAPAPARARRAHLQLRIHVLPRVRREGASQRLPQLRRGLRPPAAPPGTQLERRQFSRSGSCKHEGEAPAARRRGAREVLGADPWHSAGKAVNLRGESAEIVAAGPPAGSYAGRLE